MADKGSYAGKIKHSGTQTVQAPFAKGNAPKGTVKRGEDLRTGRGK